MARIDSSNSIGANGNLVTGVPPTTDRAIAIWNGTDGTSIQNSLDIIQVGGAIEASAFLTRRSVVTEIIVYAYESWIAPALELEITGSISIESDGELIII